MSLDLRQMLKAGVHFGHRTSRWSPKMRPFIWGARNKVHLFDVSKTAFLLERAGSFLKDLASNGKNFLWVGTKRAAQDTIKKAATDLNMQYCVHRWIGGTLSNYDEVKKAVRRYLHLKDVIKKPLIHYKKKELVALHKEIERLEKNIGGIVGLDFPPAAVILVDAKKEATAVKEAARLGIPVIALVDTNTDPEGISHIIPANDDSPRSIEFVVNYLVEQINEGKKHFEANKEEIKKAQAAQRAEKQARTAEATAQNAAPAETTTTQPEAATEAKAARPKAAAKTATRPARAKTTKAE